ncbi:MAG: ferritin-like domain-containing protein [Mariprofundaceae bacterium]|nr:ferritin-like domain-containing protein [Mariprofundaceae bacterium]
MINVFMVTGTALAETDVDAKIQQTHDIARQWRRGAYSLNGDTPVLNPEEVGRPELPRLVQPRDLPKRGLGTQKGRIAMMHAVAHIEFNAINLALDADHRFRNMPRDYYRDWLRVADEEARHFSMVRDYLRENSHDYGDFDAHNGLWEMAEKTATDVLERMALVPRVLEARGLDVTPAIIDKLRQAGDREAVAILEVIYSEEIGHVKIGTRWFRHICAERGLAPDQVFRKLLKKHFPNGLHGPFNRDARDRAGFSETEMRYLTAHP